MLFLDLKQQQPFFLQQNKEQQNRKAATPTITQKICSENGSSVKKEVEDDELVGVEDDELVGGF